MASSWPVACGCKERVVCLDCGHEIDDDIHHVNTTSWREHTSVHHSRDGYCSPECEQELWRSGIRQRSALENILGPSSTGSVATTRRSRRREASPRSRDASPAAQQRQANLQNRLSFLADAASQASYQRTRCEVTSSMTTTTIASPEPATTGEKRLAPPSPVLPTPRPGQLPHRPRSATKRLRALRPGLHKPNTRVTGPTRAEQDRNCNEKGRQQ